MKDKLERFRVYDYGIILISGILTLILFTSVSRIPRVPGEDGIRIMFYNVENLFDTIDSDLNDGEFLPSGIRRWNTYRYTRKLNSISKVIASSGRWRPPDIIGLCEVENSEVISDLLSNTFLKRVDYKQIYGVSADTRGIGVALIYSSRFRILSSEVFYPVYSSGDTLATRSVLFSKLADDKDTLGIVVTHWPSRRGGVSATEKLRKIVSDMIKEKILEIENELKIVVMGDFNCEPDSDLIINLINSSGDNKKGYSYFNPSISTSFKEYGSYKYQGLWLQYDQFILNRNLLDAYKGYSYVENSFSVIRHDYMLSTDKTYRGMKPFSTFAGPRYSGGYSDHLPIIIDLDTDN